MSLIPYRRREGGLARLHDDFESMLRNFFGEVSGPFQSGDWMPAVDIIEREDAIIVKAELPGTKPADISLTVQGNLLTIAGEKKFEKEARREDFYRIERSWGSFRRTIGLPAEVDVDRIEARHENGVLTITMPKSEHTKSRQIDIK